MGTSSMVPLARHSCFTRYSETDTAGTFNIVHKWETGITRDFRRGDQILFQPLIILYRTELELCFLLMCFIWFAFDLKFILQKEQVKSSIWPSPCTLLLCFFNSYWVGKLFRHCEQEYSFASWWTFMWVVRLLLCRNVFSHKLHWKMFFSPNIFLWTFSWLLRFFSHWKVKEQVEYSKTFPSCTFM